MNIRSAKKSINPYSIAILLALFTLAAYWRVLGNEFLTIYDDDSYVLNNTHVLNGLNWEGIRWAFGFHVYNWHPLTWMSHMLDVSFYNCNPMGHHGTSMILHALSAAILFLALNRLTKSIWKSAFVAALFAVHPLHVESVAWIAERKDVLSGLFWMLTMLAYARYIERPNRGRYAVMLASFTLGLMAKPMLVTLPLVLLLLDFWPLGRFTPPQIKGKKEPQQWPGWKLLLEKVPLLALTIGSSILTFFAQKYGGAMTTPDEFPLRVRLANALVTYCVYIGKMIWPTKLAVLYPHPGTSLPIWAAPGAALLLLAVTTLVLIFRKSRPYLTVGWLWYVITLVPVIGLIQVGKQAMANRYTYIPLIGLFIAIGWLLPDLFGKARKAASALTVMAIVIIAACAAGTWVQLGHWHDSISLFDYTARSTKNNSAALGNLGWAYGLNNDWKTAGKYFAEALKIKPKLYDMHYGLAVSYYTQGKFADTWREMHAAQRYGYVPNASFINALKQKMPEPKM